MSTIFATKSKDVYYYTVIDNKTGIIIDKDTIYYIDNSLDQFHGTLHIYCQSDGKLHRVDGPAVSGNNFEEYFKDGKRHREDGPAIVSLKEQMKSEFFLDGIRYKKEEFFEKISVENKKKMIFNIDKW